MPALANADFDRETGQTIFGWPAVHQSVRELILTSFGDRVMREYYGSNIPAFLGRNVTADVLERMATVLGAAMDVFEPRFAITNITFTQVAATGRIAMRVTGEYRPNALAGGETTDSTETFELDL